MNRIFRSFIYDWLYECADYLLKKYPVCNIHIENGIVKCNRSDGPCCGGCKYLGEEGCAIRCLGCKLGFCYESNSGPYFGNMSIKNPRFVINQNNPYLSYINNYKHVEHFFTQGWLIGMRFHLLRIRTPKAEMFKKRR